MGNKKDMSSVCGMHYEEYGDAVEQQTMTQEDYDKWLNDNCGQCCFMCEVCMSETCTSRTFQGFE